MSIYLLFLFFVCALSACFFNKKSITEPDTIVKKDIITKSTEPLKSDGVIAINDGPILKTKALKTGMGQPPIPIKKNTAKKTVANKKSEKKYGKPGKVYKTEPLISNSTNNTYESDVQSNIESNTESASSLEEYKVELGADENLDLNKTGHLKVWIGSSDLNPDLGVDMVSDNTTFPASIGQSARITPIAPDFKINPLKTECIRIDPSGSSVTFELTPQKIGEFKVSARVELFDNPNCEGTPIPKSTNRVSVNVHVNKTDATQNGAIALFSIVWDKFLSFWGALVTLLFGALLFVIRRKIKKKTGYDDKESKA